MNTIDLASLSNAILFSELSEQQIGTLVSNAQIKTFAPQETIIEEGKVARNLWVVYDGEVEVFRHLKKLAKAKDMSLAQIGKNGAFGEMSFFTGAPHSASVRAVKETTVIQITKEAYDKLIENDDLGAYKLANNTVTLLSRRLELMNEWVSEIAQQNNSANDGDWKSFKDKVFNDWYSV